MRGGGGGNNVSRHWRSDARRRLAFESRSIARAHEQTLFHPRAPAALEIAQFVADQVTFRQLDPKLVAGVEQELRGWLAAVPRLVRRFRRHGHSRKTHSRAHEIVHHTPLERRYLR